MSVNHCVRSTLLRCAYLCTRLHVWHALHASHFACYTFSESMCLCARVWFVRARVPMRISCAHSIRLCAWGMYQRRAHEPLHVVCSPSARACVRTTVTCLKREHVYVCCALVLMRVCERVRLVGRVRHCVLLARADRAHVCVRALLCV